MNLYFDFFKGADILFNGESASGIKRKKVIDTKKEIKIAKNIKKTSVLQRSSNRIRKIVNEVLS